MDSGEMAKNGWEREEGKGGKRGVEKGSGKNL